MVEKIQGCPPCIVSTHQSAPPVHALGEVFSRPERCDERLRRDWKGLRVSKLKNIQIGNNNRLNNFLPIWRVLFCPPPPPHLPPLNGNSIDIHLRLFSLGLSRELHLIISTCCREFKFPFATCCLKKNAKISNQESNSGPMRVQTNQMSWGDTDGYPIRREQHRHA